MRGTRLFLRFVVLAAAASMIPACGSTGGPALKGGGGTSLLSDGFGGVAPDPAKWNANADGGTLVQDGASGSPAPSIQMTGVSAGQDPILTSVDTFATPSLTISVRMAVSGTAPLQGRGVISIFDAGNGVVATAEWFPDATELVLTIDSDSTTIVAPAADGAYHTLVFKVDGAGNATWTLDGGAPDLTGSAAWPAGLSSLSLQGDTSGGGSNNAVFHFDTVSVTTP